MPRSLLIGRVAALGDDRRTPSDFGFGGDACTEHRSGNQDRARAADAVEIFETYGRQSYAARERGPSPPWPPNRQIRRHVAGKARLSWRPPSTVNVAPASS